MSGAKKPAARKKAPVKPKVIWANISNTHYPSVRQCIEEMGYRITESEWKNMILWCDAAGSIEMASSLEPWQFYNHFPGIWTIARKVELARNIDRLNKVLPDLFYFHPKTFLIPGQSTDMKLFMQSIPKKHKRTFIIKPDRGSQGKGISLIQDPDDMEGYYEMSVAQQYIPPFLIDGFKFDLRIYVLVTSVDPLRIYIFKEGMARFCTEPYVKPRQGNLDHVYSHLTNYSLNKKNENFEQPQEATSESGSKRSLTSVLTEIKNQGHDTDALQREIDSMIRLTLASVQPFLANNYHTAVTLNDGKSRCFEILGFDVLIDKHLHPWLLEVNCMPSLACDSPFDKSLKGSLIKGALQILNLNPNFKKLVLARQRAVTQKRISGVTKLPIPVLFDPDVESDIARTTQWRQLYPLKDSEPGYAEMELALKAAREHPVGGIETTASRARKEAALAKIKENQEYVPPKKRVAKRVIPKYDPVMKAVQPLSKRLTPRIKPVQQTFASTVKAPVAPLVEENTMTNFTDCKKNEIDDAEERERLRTMRNQMLLASSSGLLQAIKTMLDDVNKPKEVKKPVLKVVKQQVLKPVVACRQVVMECAT